MADHGGEVFCLLKGLSLLGFDQLVKFLFYFFRPVANVQSYGWPPDVRLALHSELEVLTFVQLDQLLDAELRLGSVLQQIRVLTFSLLAQMAGDIISVT